MNSLTSYVWEDLPDNEAGGSGMRNEEEDEWVWIQGVREQCEAMEENDENSSETSEDEEKAREKPSRFRRRTANNKKSSSEESLRRITRSQTRGKPTHADLGIHKPLKRLKTKRAEQESLKITRKSTRQKNTTIKEMGRKSRKNQTYKKSSR